MKKIFIATGNLNKIKEFKEIFDLMSLDVELVSPLDYNDKSQPIEDGKTYAENATIKAKYYYDKYHLPTFADDSGMEIEFLNNFPGIYSARFMASYSYKDKNDALIRILEDAPNRNASFICVISYIDQKGEIHTFEGINKGIVSDKQRGNDGFGFDPIFIIPEFNKTEAELGLAYKNKYSHRAIATNKFVNYLKTHE